MTKQNLLYKAVVGSYSQWVKDFAGIHITTHFETLHGLQLSYCDLDI